MNLSAGIDVGFARPRRRQMRMRPGKAPVGDNENS